MNASTIKSAGGAVSVLILVSLLIPFGIACFAMNAAAYSQPNNTSQVIPPDVPPEYQTWYYLTNQWLDQKTAEWTPTHNYLMKFGNYHFTASSNEFNKFDLDIDKKYTGMLAETGADVVAIGMFPTRRYTKQQLQMYDEIIRNIRNNDSKVAIYYWYSGNPVTFEQFKLLEIDSADKIMKRWNPEYFALVDEPTTRLKEAGIAPNSVTGEEWADLATQVSAKIKENNPNTVTIAGVHKGELKYIPYFTPVVDAVGFNIYGIEGIYDEYSGWLGAGDVIGNQIDYVRSEGKGVWILETWLTLRDGPGFGDAWRAPLDAKWMRLITYYGKKHEVDGVVPFFTSKYVDYFKTGATVEDFRQALAEKRRTPVFDTYKDTINENS